MGNAGTLEQARRIEEMMLEELPWLAHIGALTLAAAGAVVLAMVVPRHRQGLVGAWVAAWHLAAAGLAAWIWLDLGFRATMEGIVVVDGPALVLTGVLGASGALVIAMVRSSLAGTDREAELYAVLTATTLAATVLGSAADAALVAISLGLVSLGSFVMTGYLRRTRRGNEASIKYYVYGTVSGAIMVYGLSWWFGLAGTTDLTVVGQVLPDAPVAVAVASTALVLVGLSYKVALVPFHFWTPDAYDGAPLSVAAYLSVLPKLAGLLALARVLELALPDGALGWPTAVAAIAAITMTLGTLAAMTQTNVVRLLAWSSIAQAGFLLMGVAALDGSGRGLGALLYFAAAYAATNLTAFAVVMAVARESGSVEVACFAGLGRRHPWWTAALVVSFLSLFGLPPLSGFVGKLEVFAAAIDADLAWLAVVAIVVTIVSLYPYLRVIAPAVLERGDERPRSRPGAPLATALAVGSLATVGIGVAAEPVLDLTSGIRLNPSEAAGMAAEPAPDAREGAARAR